MNIAFPALVIFLLVLPGIIAHYTYSRGFWRWSSATSALRLTDAVSFSIVTASVLHVVWVVIAACLGYSIDFTVLLFLLSGTDGLPNEILDQAVMAITASPGQIASYNLSLYVFSAVIGLAGHKIVRRQAWDRKSPLLRFQNNWHYLLTGEVLDFPDSPYDAKKIEGVYLSAVVHHANGDYIYRGIVSDWVLYPSGELLSILLRGTHRRMLSDDRSQDEQRDPTDASYSNDPRYYDVDGHYLYLRADNIHTLNLEYISLEESAEKLVG